MRVREVGGLAILAAICLLSGWQAEAAVPAYHRWAAGQSPKIGSTVAMERALAPLLGASRLLLRRRVPAQRILS